MTRFAYPKLFAVILASLSALAVSAQCPSDNDPNCCTGIANLRQVKRTGITVPGTSYFGGLLEYTPASYTGNTNLYPLIIYFHGQGEVGPGTNASLCNLLTNTNSFDIPLPERIALGYNPTGTFNSVTREYIVLSPQYTAYCPDPVCNPANFPTTPDVKAFIDWAVANYRVDPSRIYLVGMSSGANMIIEYVSGQTNGVNNALRIAGVALSSLCSPVSRSPQGPQRIAASDLPLWEIHCAVDVEPCPDALPNEWINQINAPPAGPPTPAAQKTTLPAPCAHNTWNTFFDPAYTGLGGRNVYDWLIQYTRGASAPLPANMKGYNAVLRGSKVYVEWVTTTENNTDRFVLERANANGQYMEVASVMAAGTSAADKKYVLIDEQPVRGLNLYRLVLVNRDGQKEYFGTKRITLPNGNGYVNIPSPVRGTLNVYVNVERSQNVSITVHDLNGKTLHRVSRLFTPGLSENRVPVTTLGAGTYFVKVEGESFTETRKVLVQ